MERIERFTVPGATGEPQRMAAIKIPWTKLTRLRVLLADSTPLREVMACYEITRGAHRVAEAIVYANPDGIMLRMLPIPTDAPSPAAMWERCVPPEAGIADVVTAYWSDRQGGPACT